MSYPVVPSWFQGRSEQTLIRSSSHSTSSESQESERSTTRASNRLGEAQICCTRGGLGTRQRQLCYNYVCLSNSDLSGHFVVVFWSCPRIFYLRFLARKQPDYRFFGVEVR